MSVAEGQNRVGRIVGAVAVVAMLSAVSPAALADHWPGFLGGVGGAGGAVSDAKGLPVEFAAGKNVRWRVDLPGRSNGSPIVWGERVFVLQAVETDKRRTVMCFSRADGKLLWQSGVAYSEPEPTHPDNPACSGTPATDGERVVASFGSAGVYCYDFAGKELWRRDLGKLNHMFGNAISPVIAGDLVFLNFGPGEGTRLVALDKRTGAVAWERQPPRVDPSEQTMAGTRLAGPAMMVAMPMAGGDKNDDSMLSRDEMVGLAEAWFDKLDPDKAGKVTRQQFIERLGKAMPPPPGGGAPDGFDAGKVIGPGLFDACDADKDGSLTREELKGTFGGWFGKWSRGGEPVDLNQIIDGLNVILPPFPPTPGAPGAPGAPGGPGDMGGGNGPGGSWSTPILVRAGGRDELVVAFSNRLAAYDPKTGKPLWFSKGLADAVQNVPLWDERTGTVVATAGDMSGGMALAVRPGGSGDVTDTRRAWRQTRIKGSIGTGVLHDGHFYYVSTDGFAICADAKTGKQLWKKRLEAAGDKGSVWSSVLLADGKLYVPNQSGDVFVLKAAPTFELLATNSLGEPTNASPAAAGGELFLRTDKGLWCVAAKG